MSGSIAAKLVRPPLGLLLATLPGVAAVTALLAIGCSLASGQTDLLPMLLAGTAAVLTSCLTPAVLAAVGPIEASRFAPVAVALSSSRLGAGAALAFGVWVLAGKPEILPFWMTFLLASLATLVVETLLMISALRRATQAVGVSDGGAAR